MTKCLPFGLFAKFFVPEQGLAILLQVVDKRDGIESEIGTRKGVLGRVTLDLPTLDLIDAGAAERLRGLSSIAPVADGPNIGRIIGPGCRRDRRLLEDPFFNGELFVY